MTLELSPETKLIVASNMAVAEAVLMLMGQARHTQSVVIEKQVENLVAKALKQVDALTAKIELNEGVSA